MGALDLDERFAQEWGSSTSSHRACPIIRPARDVMSIWPDDWGNADNQQWANKLSWNLCSGSRSDVRADTGFEAHVLNYAFYKLYPFIPSRADGQVLYFDVRTEQRRSQESDVDAKMRNFYKSLQYIKQYPTMKKMFDTTLEHYWQIYWASYWNSRSKQFTVPVNPVTGSNVDP